MGFGYLLAPIPNLEIVSLILAFSGFLLGIPYGMLVGAIGFFLYSVLNPFGIAPPPVLLAQIMGGMIIGLTGGIYRRFCFKPQYTLINSLWAGFWGLLATLAYDLLTNLGAYIAAASRETLIVFLIAGLSFSLIHIISNVLIFAILFPILAKLIPIMNKSDNN
ncbi:ECF transporter S component [bacterium]|nr:ECF transporter S component [bacterium]